MHNLQKEAEPSFKIEIKCNQTWNEVLPHSVGVGPGLNNILSFRALPPMANSEVCLVRNCDA